MNDNGCMYGNCSAKSTMVRYAVAFGDTLPKHHEVHLCEACAEVLDEEAGRAFHEGTFYDWCQGQSCRSQPVDWFTGIPLNYQGE